MKKILLTFCLIFIIIQNTFAIEISDLYLETNTHEVNSEKQFTDQENTALMALTILGGVSMGLFSGFSYLSEIQNPLLKTMFISIQMAGGALGSFVLTKILIDFEIKWYWAIPYGFVGGAVLGGLIGIACFGSVFLIGTQTGEIRFNRPMDTLELIGLAVVGGAMYGGISGAFFGILEAPATSLILQY